MTLVAGASSEFEGYLYVNIASSQDLAMQLEAESANSRSSLQSVYKLHLVHRLPKETACYFQENKAESLCPFLPSVLVLINRFIRLINAPPKLISPRVVY